MKSSDKASSLKAQRANNSSVNLVTFNVFLPAREQKRWMSFAENYDDEETYLRIFFYYNNNNENKNKTEWLETSQGRERPRKGYLSLAFVEIRISFSLLYGQCGQSIAQPWIGPPIESAECLINWPMCELNWYTDGLWATIESGADLEWLLKLNSRIYALKATTDNGELFMRSESESRSFSCFLIFFSTNHSDLSLVVVEKCVTQCKRLVKSKLDLNKSCNK